MIYNPGSGGLTADNYHAAIMYADLGYIVMVPNHLADGSRCKRMPFEYVLDANNWCEAHHVTTGPTFGPYNFGTDVKRYSKYPNAFR